MATDSITTNSSKPLLKPASTEKADVFGDVTISDFLKLMITELQNQDPLNPMDNAQILNQIGQLQSISTSTKLNTTLDGLKLAQGVSSSSALINKGIAALDDKGNLVTGKVDSVTIVDNETRVNVGEQSIKLSNVKQIFGNSSGT